MLKDFRSVVDTIAVAAVFAVAGVACSSSSSPTATAGCASVKDAGCAAKDAAGCAAKSDAAGVDAAGCAAKADAAGCAAKDAGCAAIDGGGTAQIPPTTGGANVEAWLKTGAYKQWTCETAVHAARSPSPHGFNKICSNTAISSNAAGTGNWPAGAAGVKELYASLTDTVPMGYAVYTKDNADSAGGANWYYYERSGTDVVADGFGTADAGAPYTICVGCHQGAGSNAAHTPSPGSRDFVYSPISQ